MPRILPAIAIFSLLAAPVASQFPRIEIPGPDIPGLDVPIRIPGLDRMLKEDSPLTTSVADARFGVPFLDEFDPQVFTKMIHLPRGADGQFLLVRPGLYQLRFQSYCLHAGAYGPGGGDGYLWAPLRGPRARVIESVLHGSTEHPDIPQQQIQSLIWSILARTKVSDLSDDLRQVARTLLTKKEISALNGGALAQVPHELFDRAFGDLPGPVRRVFEAEARLRSMFVSGVSDFDELERVAVLTGEPPPQEEGPIIPEGRWSYHPDGYFVRYFPSGYQRTLVQLYVPEDLRTERDAEGRITRIADAYGDRIEATYDDAIEPLQLDGDDAVRGHAFSRVRFVHRVVCPPEVTLDWEADWRDAGMTLVGVPGGDGQGGMPQARFGKSEQLYTEANACQDQLDQLVEAIAEFAKDRGRPDGQPDELMALAHFALALQALMADAPHQEPWAAEHVELVYRAWQSAFLSYLGQQSPASAAAAWRRSPTSEPRLAALGNAAIYFVANGDGEGAAGFGSGSGAAQPGNPGRQRLALGDQDPNKNKATDADIKAVQREKDVAQAVRDAFEQTDPSDYSDLEKYQDAVKAKAEQLMKEQGLLKGNQKAHSPMGTHCEQPFPIRPGGPRSDSDYAKDWEAYDRELNWKDFVENWVKPQHFGSDPDIVFDAALAHEQVHRDSLAKQLDPCNWANDPKNVQQDELKAYQKQIDMLQEWLDHDC